MKTVKISIGEFTATLLDDNSSATLPEGWRERYFNEKWSIISISKRKNGRVILTMGRAVIKT